jgi:hypothetical protein
VGSHPSSGLGSVARHHPSEHFQPPVSEHLHRGFRDQGSGTRVYVFQYRGQGLVEASGIRDLGLRAYGLGYLYTPPVPRFVVRDRRVLLHGNRASWCRV